jgi:hypothetical protein
VGGFPCAHEESQVGVFPCARDESQLGGFRCGRDESRVGGFPRWRDESQVGGFPFAQCNHGGSRASRLDGDTLSRGSMASREFRSPIARLKAAEREQPHAILRAPTRGKVSPKSVKGGAQQSVKQFALARLTRVPRGDAERTGARASARRAGAADARATRRCRAGTRRARFGAPRWRGGTLAFWRSDVLAFWRRGGALPPRARLASRFCFASSGCMLDDSSCATETRCGLVRCW